MGNPNELSEKLLREAAELLSEENQSHLLGALEALLFAQGSEAAALEAEEESP